MIFTRTHKLETSDCFRSSAHTFMQSSGLIDYCNLQSMFLKIVQNLTLSFALAFCHPDLVYGRTQYTCTRVRQLMVNCCQVL